MVGDLDITLVILKYWLSRINLPEFGLNVYPAGFDQTFISFVLVNTLFSLMKMAQNIPFESLVWGGNKCRRPYHQIMSQWDELTLEGVHVACPIITHEAERVSMLWKGTKLGLQS